MLCESGDGKGQCLTKLPVIVILLCLDFVWIIICISCNLDYANKMVSRITKFIADLSTWKHAK